jgi:hypothetical protein
MVMAVSFSAEADGPEAGKRESRKNSVTLTPHSVRPGATVWIEVGIVIVPEKVV